LSLSLRFATAAQRPLWPKTRASGSLSLSSATNAGPIPPSVLLGCLDTPQRRTDGTPPNGWKSKSSALTATSQLPTRRSSDPAVLQYIPLFLKMSSSFFKKRLSPIKPGDPIDYKDVDLLKKFITDRGKILPRRLTGLTAKQQRDLTTAVKRARIISLLPFVNPEG